MAGRKQRRRFVVLAAITCMSLALPAVAQAGDISCERILAVSTDGRLVAGARSSDRGADCYLARPSKTRPPEIVARAECTLKEEEAYFPCDLAPAIDQWRWSVAGNPAKGLVTIDAASAAELARLRYDDDTDVLFLEAKRKGTWLRIEAMEETHDRLSIAGAVSSASTLVVVLHTDGYQGITYGDTPMVFPVAEIDKVDERWKRARASAEKSTANIYRQKRGHSGIFAEPPTGESPELWGMRTRHGVARVLRKWQIADGFRPLPIEEIRRALGLVALLEAPQRKHQALRWFLRTKQKNAAEAESLLTQLRASAETRALAEHLATAEDPLWGLPGFENKLTADELAKLSTAQLTWLRRAVHASFGARFDDPQSHAYFEQLRWYRPMSKLEWRAVLADARWQRDPDEFFLAARCGAPEGWPPVCHNLQLLHKLLAARSP
jgi:hypothetical protein